MASEAEAKSPRRTRLQQQAMRRTVGCDPRNQPYVRDDAYLVRGWPIGIDVVEAVYEHLVHDRLETSGMRWPQEGEQRGLKPSGRIAQWL
jgi:hypothetical protein